MKLLALALLGVFTLTVSAQDLIKSVESKRTGESITAFCDEYTGDECSKVSLRYINPKKGIDDLITTISEKQISDQENVVDHLMISMETKQMLRNKYKVFATFRKVCEMGRNSDNTGCMFKMLISTGIILGVGFGGSAGFAIEPIAKSLALGGVIFSAAASDLSVAQFFLFYPALAVDLARLVVVYPIKTLINKIRTRTLKRKIIPVLEELKYEIDNAPKKSELENESVYDVDSGRVMKIKHRHFKKIFKSLKELDLNSINGQSLVY